MSYSDPDYVAEEVTFARESLEFGNTHGWEKQDEEWQYLKILVGALEEQMQLCPSPEIETELRESLERLAEVDAETAEEVQRAESWANSVSIELDPIPDDIVDCAAEYYQNEFGFTGLVSYCRHRLTNYDELLKSAREFERFPYVALKVRINSLLEAALNKMGITEFNI